VNTLAPTRIYEFLSRNAGASHINDVHEWAILIWCRLRYGLLFNLAVQSPFLIEKILAMIKVSSSESGQGTISSTIFRGEYYHLHHRHHLLRLLFVDAISECYLFKTKGLGWDLLCFISGNGLNAIQYRLGTSGRCILSAPVQCNSPKCITVIAMCRMVRVDY